jgi:hypothetical protein
MTRPPRCPLEAVVRALDRPCSRPPITAGGRMLLPPSTIRADPSVRHVSISTRRSSPVVLAFCGELSRAAAQHVVLLVGVTTSRSASLPHASRSARTKSDQGSIGCPPLLPTFFPASRRAAQREGAAGDAPLLAADPQVLRLAAGLRAGTSSAIDLVGIVVAACVALALRYDRISGPLRPRLPAWWSACSWPSEPSPTSGWACTAAVGASQASRPRADRLRCRLGSLVSATIFYATTTLAGISGAGFRVVLAGGAS